MTVTAEPKRAKTDANSMPTAPAPMTTRLFGHLLELQDLVRGEDRLAVGCQAGEAARPRSRGQDDVLRLDPGLAAVALDHDRCARPRAGPGP